MRFAQINRKTKETDIFCEVNIDGVGTSEISTGIGFFNHMLEVFSHHSLIDLKLKANGDTYVDFHHTVEDTAYALAQAINKSIGEKRGINRYGFFYITMDESLSRAVIDLSGRPELVWKVNLGLKKVGEMDTELFHEFFKAFSNELKCNLHIENFYGNNNHHIIESCFKSFARSVKQALTIDERIKNIIPSSKGTL
jgi:imidazoleglycerol-phosphate dehydratase